MKFHILYDQSEPRESLESGVISSASWERLLPYLNQAFAVKPTEKIIGITVTPEGIRAKFKTKCIL